MRAAVALVLGTGLLGLATPAVHADEVALPTVTIVSPSPTAPVAGEIVVQLRTEAGFVRIGTYGPSGAFWNDPVPVTPPAGGETAGTAEDTFPTDGWMYFNLRAQSCAGATADTCSGPLAGQQYFVKDQRATFLTPEEAVFTRPSVDGPMTFRVDDPYRDGTFRLDLVQPERTWIPAETLGRFGPSEAASVDFANRIDAAYAVRAFRCSAVVPDACDSRSAISPQVLVGEQLDISGLVADTVSPNGDGRHDLADLRLQLDSSIPQTVSWSVVHNGVELAQPAPLLDGQPLRGAVEDRLDLARGGTVAYPDGTYDLVLDVHGERSGHVYDEQLRVPFVVNGTPVTVGALMPSYPVFHPIKDGYRDAVTFRAGVATHEYWEVSGATAEVVDASGTVVRRLPLDVSYQTRVVLTWNGRLADGRVAREGTYRLRVKTEDVFGNRFARISPAVGLTHKHLESRAWKRTVSAVGSLIRDDSGRCSRLARPGASRMTGSVGYYSRSRCGSSAGTDDRARGVHAMKLPAVAVPGTINISLYGGNPSGFSPAFFHYLSVNEHNVGGMEYWGGIAQRPSTSWSRATDMIRADGTIRWRLTTESGSRFDVKTYTVIYRYRALTY